VLEAVTVTPLFAVDSARVVNDWVWGVVTAAAGGPPAVWFRYLDTLTAAEAAYLQGKGCAVGLVYRGATATSVAGGYAAGVTDAQSALSLYNGIGCPDNLLILADIEASWNPTQEWFCGWADTIRASRAWKSGGVYGAPSAPNFWQPLLAARAANANAALLVLWAAQPVTGISTAANMPEWGPETDGNCPVVAWQYYEGQQGDAYGGLVDLDEVNSDYMQVLWSAPKAPESALQGLARLAQVQGQVDPAADKLAIPVTFAGPAGSQDQTIVLDTGAFELLLTGQTAAALGLPNLGALQVEGVTGSAPAYYSRVDVTVGGQHFPAVPCVVDPSAPFQLFGLRLFIDQHLALVANLTTGLVEFWGPPV
jgi:hypothetical protein